MESVTSRIVTLVPVDGILDKAVVVLDSTIVSTGSVVLDLGSVEVWVGAEEVEAGPTRLVVSVGRVEAIAVEVPS